MIFPSKPLRGPSTITIRWFSSNLAFDIPSISPLFLKTEKYSKVKIIDFPKNIPFHPQSLSLYKKSEKEYILYILNHAVSDIIDGKERIEKIIVNYNPRKEEISMIYDSSILLPNEYFLKIDSIHAINEDIFYFTTNTPFPSPRESDDLLDIKNYLINFAYDLLKPIMIMLNIKAYLLYHIFYFKKIKLN